MNRRPQLVAIGVVVIAVVAGLWFGASDRSTVPVDAEDRVRPGITSPPFEPDQAPPPAVSTIVVHVAGWVVRPGLVMVEADARLADAVAAAGGARPGASLAAVNLAEPLVDGQQVVVPGPGSALPPPSPATTAGDGRIRLNDAGVDDLDRLPGIGPVIAERIVAFRETNGPFESVEDLLGVPGVGERKLASIRDLLIVP